MSSSRHRFATGLLLAIGLGAPAADAVGTGTGATAKPPPSFAEIPDPAYAQTTVVFQPGGGRMPPPMMPAVRPPPPPPAPPPVTAIAAAVPVAAPAGAPLSVRISFAAASAAARQQADALAAALRAQNVAVEEVAAPRRMAAAAVLFGFVEDRDAAVSVGQALTRRGVDSPVTLAPPSMSIMQPGLIEVTLPG